MRPLIPSKFMSCWKVNDPEWVAQRKKDWKILVNEEFRDATPAEIASNRKYFMSGIGGYDVTTNYFLFLAPLPSGEMIREFVMDSGVFVSSEIRRIIGNNLSKTAGACNVSWYRQYAKHYADAFYRDGYQEMYVIDPVGRKRDVTPDVTSLFSDFLVYYTNMLEKRIEYTGYVELVDYVISALPFANKQYHREAINRYGDIENIFLSANATLGDDSSSAELKKFAIDILEKEQDIRNGWAINSHLDEDSYPVTEAAGKKGNVSSDFTNLFSDLLDYLTSTLEEQIECSGYVELIDNMISALPMVNNQSHRERISRHGKIEKLFLAANAVLRDNASPAELKRYATDILEKEQDIRNGWAINSHLDKDREQS